VPGERHGAVRRLRQHRQQLEKRLQTYFWKEKAECQMAADQES